MKKLFTFLLFFVLFQSLPAETSLKLNNSQLNGVSLAPYILYLEDTTNSLEIQDILKPENSKKFIENSSDSLSFGFKSHPFWFKFSVENSSSYTLQWVLEIGYPMLDRIELFVLKEDGTYEVKKEGDEKPFHDRSIKYRNFLFELNEKPNSKKTYYIRITTTSSLSFPILAWDPTSLTEKINTEQTLLGMSYGIIFIMIFYNLFILFSTGDRSYLYYILFVLFYGSFLTTLNGVAFEYLWPNQVWWANQCLPFFICSASLFGLMFGRNFLNLKVISPKFSMWMQVLMFIATLGSIISLTMKYSIAIKIATVLAGITVLTLLIAGGIGMYHRYKPARFYLIAWFALILGIGAYSLKAFGLLPNNFFTHWGVQIGAVMEMFLLSLALGDKINTLKAEKEKTQRELNIAYGRFVPHEFLNFLGKNSILEVDLGDQVLKNMTILFSDIRSFTALSETMTPEENFNFINAYLGRVVPVFRKNRGVVDKFIGDGIMALFPNQVEDAVQASLEFLEILQVYNQKRIRYGYVPIRVGIGIHCGQLMLGTIGHQEFMQGSVISDAVNLTSRIEELTKKVGASILLSESAMKQLQNPEQYNIRYIRNVKVKGKTQLIKVFEIFDGDDPSVKELKILIKAEFSLGVEAFYKKDYKKAREYFYLVKEKFPTDKATLTYLKRLEHQILKTV